VDVGEGVAVSVAVAGKDVGVSEGAVGVIVGVGSEIAGAHAVMRMMHPVRRRFFMALFISYPRSQIATYFSQTINFF
jgi:hypothetical protein